MIIIMNQRINAKARRDIMNNEIIFYTPAAFHEFVLFAIKNGLAYKATESGEVFTVVVTGY